VADDSQRGFQQHHRPVPAGTAGALLPDAGLVDIPKASAESVARAIFDGLEKEEEDIFPDPMAQTMAEAWRNGAAKELERQYAAIAEQYPAVA
jgi:hypothetical protein